MVLRCAVYLISYQTTSQPRAVVWQLYVVTCAIYYSCQGQAFLLSQVGAPTTVCKRRGSSAASPLCRRVLVSCFKHPSRQTHVTAVSAPVDNNFFAVCRSWVPMRRS